MGESTLKSHSKSKKHKQNSRCEQRETLSSFWFGSSAGTSTCSCRNKEACRQTAKDEIQELTDLGASVNSKLEKLKE